MDEEISAEELRELLDSGDPVRVVDIRSPAAFEHGHIPGSENVPFGELTSRIESFDGAEYVVTVCPHGQASQQAARLIGSYEGFDGRVVSLEPGLQGWSQTYELAVGTGEEAAADGGESDEGPEAPF
jgi:rhodanese-related sulfurtransferase